jgi:hypothetical protein
MVTSLAEDMLLIFGLELKRLKFDPRIVKLWEPDDMRAPLGNRELAAYFETS